MHGHQHIRPHCRITLYSSLVCVSTPPWPSNTKSTCGMVIWCRGSCFRASDLRHPPLALSNIPRSTSPFTKTGREASLRLVGYSFTISDVHLLSLAKCKATCARGVAPPRGGPEAALSHSNHLCPVSLQ